MQPKCRAGMWRGVPRYLTGPTSREPANQELCAVERHNHVAMRPFTRRARTSLRNAPSSALTVRSSQDMEASYFTKDDNLLFQ